MDSYTTVVIGAGSGGLTVAIGLSMFDKPVALVEGGAIGGDCTNVGCVPSKTLIHLASERNGHGDARAILETVQSKRDHLRDEETEWVESIEQLDFIRGWARFLGPQRLEVTHPDGTRREIRGDTIIIATGSRPRQLEIPGLPAHRLLTNENLFEQQDAPRHLVIIGSGVIAMEMAFAFRKLGSRVSILTRSTRVLAAETDAAAPVLSASLAQHDIALHTQAEPVTYNDITETLTFRAGGNHHTLDEVDRVLVAIGRVPNLDLGLERAGVHFDEKGIPTDSYGRTNVPSIYAVGDVTHTSKYTHSANSQGRRVVQRISFPALPALGSEPLYPHATFSDPEVASVGMSWQQVTQRYHPNLVKRLRYDFKELDRGYTDDLEHGFLELYVIRLTGRILGAAIVGPRASEMISFYTLAISQKMSLYHLFRLVYPYPTLSEAAQQIATNFVRDTLPKIVQELKAYLRYRFAAPPKADSSPADRPAATPQQQSEQIPGL